MKFFILSLLFISSFSVFAEKCSISEGYIPKCYFPRNTATLNIALVHYGSFMDLTRLKSVGDLVTKRFKIATKNLVNIEIKDYKIIPLAQTLPKDYRNNNITDKKRLHRLWYYDNMNAKVIKESYEEFKKFSNIKLLNNLDALLVISEAQFDGLGFASGRVGITENPMEVAWARPNQGRTEDRSNYQIVDELIHELGHIMFLGHTSNQCFKKGMTYQEMMACCKNSPSKSDVMSYCRQRGQVDEVFFHSFEICNLNMIDKLIAPSIRDGGAWNVSGRKSCR